MIHAALCAAIVCGSLCAQQDLGANDESSPRFSSAASIIETAQHPAPAIAPRTQAPPASGIETLAEPNALARNATSVLLFSAVSLIPAALLVLTAFVRISVVLFLARQALGSAQIPGNQVITALALLLTALVMAPVAHRVYQEGIAPYCESKKTAEDAWRDGTMPIKKFMGQQIIKSKHQEYLWTFHRHAFPETQPGQEPTTIEEVPLRVVAPAFLVSELTTALFMGFAIFLPFLVVDLLVSVLLSTMGLFLMPPGLVSVPIKLVLFVLADGWMLVADTLVRSFA